MLHMKQKVWSIHLIEKPVCLNWLDVFLFLYKLQKPDFKHGAPGLFTHVCMKVSWIETLQFNKSIIFVGVHFKSHTLQLK